MNLPNKLTISRFFLTVIFCFFLLREGLAAKLLAAFVFLLASVTDYYDGHYARKHNLISDFGKIMDPIADKFLILAAFFIFSRMHLMAWWMFVIILIREVLVTVIRLKAVRKGKMLAAEGAGKVKTVSQITVIVLFLAYLILHEQSFHAGLLLNYLFQLNYFLLYWVVAITVFSGASFLWNNRKGWYV